MIHYIFCLTFLLHISAALLLLINRCESVPTITPNCARENNRTSETAAAVTHHFFSLPSPKSVQGLLWTKLKTLNFAPQDSLAR